jgi:hypothetical protein
VAALSHDTPAILADFARRRNIAFPLLSDTGSKTIRALGLLNTTLAPTDANYGIPFPGTFIVDTGGVIRERHFENTHQERRTVASLLMLDGPGGRPATQATTDHLRAVSYASDEVVAPGTVFSLHVDVQPGEGIHVYAPGDHTYRVVSIDLDPSPLLQPRPIRYPASETYFFAPLKETVPVYQRPFRLVRDVMLDVSQAGQEKLRDVQTFTITGRLEYQACDDRFCFTPASAPLSWTVKVRQLDRERVARP